VAREYAIKSSAARPARRDVPRHASGARYRQSAARARACVAFMREVQCYARAVLQQCRSAEYGRVRRVQQVGRRWRQRDGGYALARCCR